MIFMKLTLSTLNLIEINKSFKINYIEININVYKLKVKKKQKNWMIQ